MSEQKSQASSESEAGSMRSPESDVEPGEVVEEELVEGAPVRRKGIYLLPNALTTASLFSGFYAIVSASNGIFDNAAIAIFVSMILDGLDGRVARLTNTQSKFGEEYDSLADMVAFGVAPGPRQRLPYQPDCRILRQTCFGCWSALPRDHQARPESWTRRWQWRRYQICHLTLKQWRRNRKITTPLSEHSAEDKYPYAEQERPPQALLQQPLPARHRIPGCALNQPLIQNWPVISVHSSLVTPDSICAEYIRKTRPQGPRSVIGFRQ